MELCHQQAGGAEDQDQLIMLAGVENTDTVVKEVGMRRKFRLGCLLGRPVSPQPCQTSSFI